MVEAGEAEEAGGLLVRRISNRQMTHRIWSMKRRRSTEMEDVGVGELGEVGETGVG